MDVLGGNAPDAVIGYGGNNTELPIVFTLPGFGDGNGAVCRDKHCSGIEYRNGIAVEAGEKEVDFIGVSHKIFLLLKSDVQYGKVGVIVDAGFVNADVDKRILRIAAGDLPNGVPH